MPPVLISRGVPLLLALAGALGCGDDDCPAGTLPSGERCVPRTDGGDTDASDEDGSMPVDAGPCDGMCSGATPLCNETTDMCVECLADTDCTDLTNPRCDTTAGACAPCDDSSQCAGRTGTELCATDGPNMGSCVECTAADASACGANPCTADNACSGFGTEQETCEPCDTDDNCTDAEHFCVPMEFPTGTARDDGYCLKATPGCDRPYTIVLSGRDSLSGVTGQMYCGVNEDLTTCEAVNALLTDTMCPSGMDTECPEGGVCRTLDPAGAALMNRCTYDCGGDAAACKMPPGAGSTCGDGGTIEDDYCGG